MNEERIVILGNPRRTSYMEEIFKNLGAKVEFNPIPSKWSGQAISFAGIDEVPGDDFVDAARHLFGPSPACFDRFYNGKCEAVDRGKHAEKFRR